MTETREAIESRELTVAGAVCLATCRGTRRWRTEGRPMRLTSVLCAAAMAAIVAVSAAGASPSAADRSARSRIAAAIAAAGGSVSIEENEPDYLLPNRSTTAFDQDHALFTPLMELNAKNRLVKGMAQSLTSSSGGRVWTITLKKGWTFHNGEPVTAQSFVDAWNAVAYGPNAWPTNAEMAEIKGYKALNPTARGEAVAQDAGRPQGGQRHDPQGHPVGA